MIVILKDIINIFHLLYHKTIWLSSHENTKKHPQLLFLQIFYHEYRLLEHCLFVLVIEDTLNRCKKCVLL
jgi:hypothetical protein